MIFRKPDNDYFELDDTIESDRMILRLPLIADFAQWAMLRQQSADFLRPWEATWSNNDLSKSSFAHRVRHFRSTARKDEAYPFFIFSADANKKLLGGVTISNVRRGIAQTATIGYWIGQPHANQGYMAEAVRLVCGFGFDQLALHRLEAACLLHNAPSARVLEKNGFEQEGLARKYLKINGEYQDHLLFARLAKTDTSNDI